MTRIHLAVASAVLTAAFVLATPAASACHGGGDPTSFGSWNIGAPSKTEVLGVGPTSVGVFTAPRTTYCNGQSYETYCQPQLVTVATVTIPPVTAPGATTPDVRVLGQTVVPSQTIGPTPVYPGSSTPVTMERIRPVCLTGPTELGVYADNVPAAGGLLVGTHNLVWLDEVGLP